MTKTEIIQQFTEMFSDSAYHLPIRWDGRDFYMTLYKFLKHYREDVEKRFGENEVLCADVAEICKGLCLAIHSSFKGNLGGAYENVSGVLDLLEERNSLFDDAKEVIGEEKLYRVVDAGDTASHDRKRIFHVPFSMRTKMSTCRYSVPGYPSLYLGTSLELCAREVHCYPPTETTIAARFEMDLPEDEDFPYPYYHPSKFEIYDNGDCKIIDLAVKPADAVEKVKKHLSTLAEEVLVPEYILLYPLIAAGSFIRAKRGDPYSPEYIIPQLVTEWLCRNEERSVTGIKYFSCASEEAARRDYNYVFPSSGVAFGVRETTKDYCAKLAHRFTLTNPVHINDYKSLADCETALGKDTKLDFIEDWKKIEKANGEITEYEIPDGVLEISNGAFRGCKNLKSVKIPDSVTKIGNEAFWRCYALESITIPAGVTEIGGRAFAVCKALESITIPASVTEIGDGAFARCDSLTIYCEAKEKPEGWDENWNPHKRPVVWDYKNKGIEP